MKKKKLHPAVESAMAKTKQRYIIFAVLFVLCAILIALSFLIKPKQKALVPEVFGKDTAVDTYVKSEITIVSPMFSQDIVDENGNVTGEMYHILAVDESGNRFMLSATKEFYEKTLKPLEDNAVQDIESGQIEILDKNLKTEVLGYARTMSKNLTTQLNEYLTGYENVLLKYSLEAVDEPASLKSTNYILVAGICVGVASLMALIMAVSASAELGRVKKKYEKNGNSQKEQ